MRRKLFCWTASGASGGGAPVRLWRSSVLVRMFVKVGSDFNQKAPQFFRIRLPAGEAGILGENEIHLSMKDKRNCIFVDL